MTKLLISACLLGQKVRYDGKDNLQTHARLQAMVAAGDIISICPEMVGGLSTPREPAEIEPGASALDVIQGNARIMTINHIDVTAEYLAGAYKALQLAQQHHVRVAILKARSPSCGSQQVYDGSFSRTLIPGMGVTAALLQQHGIQVFDEDHIGEAINASLSDHLSAH
jgi:uncharacterized protein YbbK (DUF523 family)